MSKKMISIVGPTAVGKTGFALDLIDYIKSNSELSSQFAGFDVMSADSRQVYKDLAVISGADLPQDFQSEGSYFIKDDIKIHGILMLNYQEEWSLAHFKKFAEKIIRNSWKQSRLPIVVGGTGLYHDHLFSDSSQIWIGPNEDIRKELDSFSVEELQKRLKEVNEDKFFSMNNSDQNNPVRLIRAIEVAVGLQLVESGDDRKTEDIDFVHLMVGLTDQLEPIEERIKQRVVERFENGAIQEVEEIQQKSQDFPVNKQLTTATGVKEIQAYLDGDVEKEQCLEKWSLREFQYAKRQLTWWKNKENIIWYKVSEQNWQKSALESINNFLLSEKS